MATVFWDSHGVILINYIQKGKTITGAYYASLLDKLNPELAEKRSHLQKKKILFHTSAVAMAKIHELRFELLDHPPYSPDLAPSYFFLSTHIKIAFGEQRFSLNEEAITFVNNYFAEYYLDGLQRWEHRWEKCVELQVEKKFLKICLISLLSRKLFKPPSYLQSCLDVRI